MEMRVRVLIICLATTLTFQRSIKQDQETENNSSYRALYDEFPDEPLQTGDCACNERYLKHYEVKGCSVSERNSCGCPTRYDCSNMNEIDEEDNVCYYKGLRYSSGMWINITNPCERCRCSRGPIAEIVCYPVECPEFDEPLPLNCHYVYEKNKCCPSDTVCVEDILFSEGNNLTAVCEYSGRIYPFGARMYSEDNDCEICLCSESWLEENQSTCYKVDCGLEKKRSKLLEGCLPIYHGNTCCPIDYYCAPGNEDVSDIKSKADTDEINDDIGCTLQGKLYAVRQFIIVSNSTSSCVLCSCVIPPDFTCILQYCTPNPNSELCSPHYMPEQCCPLYDCMYGDAAPLSNHDLGRHDLVRSSRELEDDGTERSQSNPDSTCFETECSEYRTCFLYRVICGHETCEVPTCLETNSSCLTSTCSSGCSVIEQDENRCVTCSCGENTESNVSHLKCHMPQCKGQNCLLLGGSNGCPTCSCQAECGELHCQPGCNVLLEREGGCPKCVCEEETDGCPTPVCEHEGCRIENLPNGCPTCVCSRGRISHERELEGSPSSVNQQVQPHQQQQQSSDDINEDKIESVLPEGGDYEDILVMSSSADQGETKEKFKVRSVLDDHETRLKNFSWDVLETELNEPNLDNAENSE